MDEVRASRLFEVVVSITHPHLYPLPVLRLDEVTRVITGNSDLYRRGPVPSVFETDPFKFQNY